MSLLPLFVPECHVDTALTRALVVYRRDFDDLINHKHGVPNMAKEMRRQWQVYGASRTVVGIVDRDKNLDDVAYLGEFTELISGSLLADAPHSIRRHPACVSHYLIVLNPACDTWVWEAAGAAGVALLPHGLPTGRWDFTDYCKTSNVENLPPLKSLLAAISKARPAVYAELADFVADIMAAVR